MCASGAAAYDSIDRILAAKEKRFIRGCSKIRVCKTWVGNDGTGSSGRGVQFFFFDVEYTYGMHTHRYTGLGYGF